MGRSVPAATSASRSSIGPLSISGRVKQCANQKPITARLRDISAPASIAPGGVREAMPKGTTPRIKFTLPGLKAAFEMEAEVAWSDLKGSAGFRFKNVPASSQAILEQWLDEQMAKEIPGAKESLSADSESAH